MTLMNKRFLDKFLCLHTWESHRVEIFENFKYQGDTLPSSSKTIETLVCTKCGKIHQVIYS